MPDCVSASIEIGGFLSRQEFFQLAKLIEDEDLSIEWDGPSFKASHRTVGEPLRLFAHGVPWGRFPDLEAWCISKRLAFSRWSAGFDDQMDAERVIVDSNGGAESIPVDSRNRVILDREKVKTLGSFESILAYFDAAEAPVPPLVVDGDGGSDG